MKNGAAKPMRKRGGFVFLDIREDEGETAEEYEVNRPGFHAGSTSAFARTRRFTGAGRTS
jgi:hypothetical protein